MYCIKKLKFGHVLINIYLCTYYDVIYEQQKNKIKMVTIKILH